MKKNSTVIAIILLITLSAAVYLFQLTLFHSPRDTLFYLIQDLAFLPVQVALVTIAVGRIIGARERRERLNKTNMLMSAFFSEIGSDFIRQMLPCISNRDEIAPFLSIKDSWTAKDFVKASDTMKKRNILVACKPGDLIVLKQLLTEKRRELMVILANPMLLEHEAFTDMLWAIFHLTDELLARDSIEDLPETDISHLNYDVKRALGATFIHWLGYMNHIRTDYPYLFSLENRRNPVNNCSDIIIRQ